MDTLRGNFSALDVTDMDIFSTPDDAQDYDLEEVDDRQDHTPPPAIGQDERRMQVRAYNFWAGMLEDRKFPAIDDLDPTLLPDFGPYSVLLDFSAGVDDPSVNFIGSCLAEECLDVGDGLPRKLSQVPPRSLLSRITDHYMQILANQSPIGFEAEFVNQFGATILYRGILLPFSSDDETIDFIYGVINWKEIADAQTTDELLLEIDQALEEEVGRSHKVSTSLTDWADGPVSDMMPARPSIDLTAHADEAIAKLEATTSQTPETGMALADWLASARDQAAEASDSEDRTRSALYDAVSRSYDFALATVEAPQDFAEILKDAGLKAQDRAPMTPIVKLVFGVDYDKTRLTEYAAVLAWAMRNRIERGELADRLKTADGGLKGIVAKERAFRRGNSAATSARKRTAPRKAIANKLRAMAPQDLAAVSSDGDEFGLVMIQRTADGNVVMLGEVPADASFIEKAARTLIG